ncbi:MAG: CofH family radical SAM protein [Bacteroidota bacterium]|nr:CofH family radical SAM protein [Bacteroidota bacterium]
MRNISEADKKLRDNVMLGKRILAEEAVRLFNFPLSELALMADFRKRKVSGDAVYYNRNIHIEPTNLCVNHCLFCSYRAQKGDAHAWEYTHDEMESLAKNGIRRGITEIHVVGGVHPDWDIEYYMEILRRIRKLSKKVHIKAFTAEEIVQMSKNAGLSVEKGLQQLIHAGLNSIPGGGAEIFDTRIRKKICPDKIDAETWLSVHKAVHNAGLSSNCTMLYGQMETLENRISHMLALRDLQDKTGGFNAFIPLKFKAGNNKLSYLGETPVSDDMRNYAVSRIFLDNIPHLKAYWPMIGKDNASVSLGFGVDDFDGTIDDSTKIYSLAGSDEQNPGMQIQEIEQIARIAGFQAVERDSLYRVL